MNRFKEYGVFFTFIICLLLVAVPEAQAQEQGNSSKQKKEIPEAEKSVTQHSVEIGGQQIDYDATAGTMILENGKGEAIAEWGYIAYTKRGVNDPSSRPVTFVFNGGPGSSSIWLHMGAVGPRRVVVNDPDFTKPAPYQVVDNEYSILDVTDIVMVDPVGTGISRAVGEAENKDFWGVQEDIRSVSNFINSYVSEYNRWNSPKYLLGESYGTFRSAGLAKYLQDNMGISLNGIVLVSNVLDLRTIAFGPDDDLPYISFLPTYAAIAWYHDKLDNKPEDLYAFLDEVRNFAGGAYASALMKGNDLPEAERNRIIQKMAEYTGLSTDYIDKADLRVTESEFNKELLNDEGYSIGRLDSRYKGFSYDLLRSTKQYDPQSAAISPAYNMAFMSYYHNELNFGQDRQYNFSAYSLPGFNWNWDRPGSYFPFSPNTSPDLASAMIENPNLKVLVLNGIYDAATPFYGTEYTFSHIDIPEELESNISMEYYEAGHMMYTHIPSLKKFKEDVASFITGN